MVPVQVWVTVVPLVEDTVTCPDGGVDAAAGTARAAKAATGTSNAQVQVRGRAREVMAGSFSGNSTASLAECVGVTVQASRSRGRDPLPARRVASHRSARGCP